MASPVVPLKLKPLDEDWHVRALLFIAKYERQHHTGPKWTEISDHMGWKRNSFGVHIKMNKLRTRGLEWTDGVERSTRLTDEGLTHLHTTVKARSKSVPR